MLFGQHTYLLYLCKLFCIMKDQFRREINYLRLSVTDLCDLRCIYCMPEGGVQKLAHEEILSIEEIDEIVGIAAEKGITKVRITGGEPLVRRGIEEIISRIAPKVEEVAVTTNALLLPDKIDGLGDVDRYNISLDSLNPDKYEKITRGGDLKAALRGVDVALERVTRPLKLNVVLMGGVNDDEIGDFVEFGERKGINVRFIEVMPIGECACWNSRRFIKVAEVLKAEPELRAIGEVGVAREYRKSGSDVTVGLISPISAHFCGGCNKIRITADGRLKSCLHSEKEIKLKGLNKGELEDAISDGIYEKPTRHELEVGKSHSMRNMNAIGG